SLHAHSVHSPGQVASPPGALASHASPGPSRASPRATRPAAKRILGLRGLLAEPVSWSHAGAAILARSTTLPTSAHAGHLARRLVARRRTRRRGAPSPAGPSGP